MATLVNKTANCGTMADWFKSAGRWYSYSSTPKVGDLVFFDWNGKHTNRHHVGLVIGVQNGGATITTIEGNTTVGNDSNGGEVMQRTRQRAYITGYGRPAYASTTERDNIIARAKAELGVKESPYGSNKVKYNTWFYGSAVSGFDYPWCAVFICWVFLATSSSSSASTNATASFGGYIKQFQSWLNTNYNTGLTVDGIYGPKTQEAAIKAWQTEMNTQEAAGLEVDGKYGSKSAAAAKKCKVAYGAKGNLTRIIQGALYCHGYNAKGFDGTYGAGTKAAVISLQRDKGLAADGVVGVNTWAVLLEG